MLSKEAADHATFLDGAATFQYMPEGDLWDLFRLGDATAFTYIYAKYFPLLLNYGHQFTKDHELVKDVIQDLFIYLKEKRTTLGATTSIRFYLYQAYRRRIFRYLRKKKNQREGKYANGYGFEITLSQESIMINSIIDEERRQQLEKAFNILTRRQKEILIYYFYENFSYQEITTVMGFSEVQYARILMGRSIAKLRKHLGALSIN